MKMSSAGNVLKPGGHIRFSSSGGMAGTPQLQKRVRPGEWPSGYSYANGGPTNKKWETGGPGFLYYADPNFGVPYLPTKNNGKPLEINWSNNYWYIFIK